MKDERNIEEVLQRALPSAPRAQMESALDRVFTRLQMDRSGVMPEPTVHVESTRRFDRRWIPLMAAVAVLVAAVWVGISWRDRDVYAVLETTDAALYRMTEGNRVLVHAGDRIAEREIVRSDGSLGAMLALADGSRVEMRSQSELSLERADDGMRIRLSSGSIIVNAAKQAGGHLYVQTRDINVAVVGTVFLVNADEDGSRVGVIEGEVRVNEGTTKTTLRPGQQVSTNRTLDARPLADEITWSRQAATHLAVLASFQKGITDTAGHLEALNQTAATAPSRATAFEEASVRPCEPDNLPGNVPGTRGGGGANSFYMTPGRTHALCMTLATLIRTAYGYAPVEAELDGMTTDPKAPARWRRPLGDGSVAGLGVEDGRRVRGGPGWVRTARYTVEAVADGPADAAAMSGPMLLALLEQRFKLKAHVETEPVPAFALVVAPGGLKIKPAEPDSCMPVPIDRVPPRFKNEAPHVLPYLRRGEKRWCGQALERNGPNQVFVAGGSTFSDLAQLLGMGFLGPVRVYDKTGITDTFNWILEFTPENNHLLPPGRAASPAEPPNVPPAPTIFVVLQQQLGLRLEPSQAPREFVVIDAIERPDPN